MSSLTKTPAQESASADSATSVSASAGTTTSVPTEASTSTTESTLSVDEYHALQYKKRVEDKAATPETILEGSSVFHTDGSMPTDYGSDISDVPMEDGGVPFSAADSESAAVAHEPVTGSRRPCKDDPSASSSKRSRNDEEEKAPTPVSPSSPRSVPTELRDLRVQLERRDTPSVSGDRSAREGVTPALRSGLRTPSPFPERPRSERSEVPMYLGGEEILSNEYEDEPDLGSSSGVHSPRFARLSTESSRAHRAVVVAGAERYPSYGQPQVDRDSRALLDRLAALEQFQSVELAQLQHELRYQKAQVAEAAQTASNTQVELGTQVVRLHDRVAALEMLAYAASSSSASHQG
ncbi:hypothetical protein PC119_g26815 [Phytophthora cactorum]|uniref:Uncharacterized protein n=1 Tax=Phytophthora cactorum TaxID=29920 RepID=A0A8T0XZJ9_9STRA|nr:hypothetical protein PC113_g24226 [Phytophthora cactorum]KAG2959082.1 hypothetical protein PC119_g26815 [Phytophthora cactorum]KAG3046471.1 hypothetical protein PC122_g24337 [Phytophthora cactorum]